MYNRRIHNNMYNRRVSNCASYGRHKIIKLVSFILFIATESYKIINSVP